MLHRAAATGRSPVVTRSIAAMGRSHRVPKPCTMMSHRFLVVLDRERDVEFEFSGYADHSLRNDRIRQQRGIWYFPIMLGVSYFFRIHMNNPAIAGGPLGGAW